MSSKLARFTCNGGGNNECIQNIDGNYAIIQLINLLKVNYLLVPLLYHKYLAKTISKSNSDYIIEYVKNKDFW